MTSPDTFKVLYFPTSAIAAIFSQATARIARSLRAAQEKRRERRRQRRTMAQLRGLPGPTLSDIGIDRTEIASMVIHGRRGRPAPNR